MPENENLTKLLLARNAGVLATVRTNGRPQLSNVTYAFDESTRLIRISTVDGLVKVRNLRRDPRASLHVTSENFEAWAVAEGEAELSEVAGEPEDTVVRELVELYRDARGEHSDWGEYREAMVAARRLVVRIRVNRMYGYIPSV